MSENSTPLMRITRHQGFTIYQTSGQQVDGWFPQYQIFRDGQPLTALRINFFHSLNNPELACDIAFDMAREDIRLQLFDLDE